VNATVTTAGDQAAGVRRATKDDIGQDCPACGRVIVAGEIVALAPLGPGTNEEERKRCRKGEAYESVAAVVHLACSGFASEGEAA
jgi:hypothetical protein